MVRPKSVNQHGPKSHLILPDADEILRHGSLVVELLRLQRSQPQIGHPKAIAIFRNREQHAVLLRSSPCRFLVFVSYFPSPHH